MFATIQDCCCDVKFGVQYMLPTFKFPDGLCSVWEVFSEEASPVVAICEKFGHQNYAGMWPPVGWAYCGGQCGLRNLHANNVDKFDRSGPLVCGG